MGKRKSSILVHSWHRIPLQTQGFQSGVLTSFVISANEEILLLPKDRQCKLFNALRPLISLFPLLNSVKSFSCTSVSARNFFILLNERSNHVRLTGDRYLRSGILLLSKLRCDSALKPPLSIHKYHGTTNAAFRALPGWHFCCLYCCFFGFYRFFPILHYIFIDYL